MQKNKTPLRPVGFNLPRYPGYGHSSIKKTACLTLSVLMLMPLISCKHNRLDVDVSDVDIEPVKIERMEKDIFSLPTDSIAALTPALIRKYGDFFVQFVSQIVSNGTMRDSSYEYKMRMFITDKVMKQAYDECIKKYPNLSWLESGLSDAFRHVKYHLPHKRLPKVYSFMSGFNYSVIANDSVLAIGLEMYLGEKNPLYNMLYPQGQPLPSYRRRNMTEKNILSDCIRGWLEVEFEMPMNKTDLLSEMIRQGKLFYLHEALLPQSSDTLRLGCTASQLKWAQTNEYNTWAYMIENKILYSHSQEIIMKFTGEGPFTTAFGKDSPPKMGSWIGLQIVREYMNNHPKISLKELIDERDAQLILSRAKYRPEA